MKSLKHSKYKNTGVLFELLVRQVASDILNNKKSSPSVGIIKKYFKEGTDLHTEVGLYQSLLQETFKTGLEAKEFVASIVGIRKTMNETALRRQKFNLIREITSNYNTESFFAAKIQNYPLMACIYKLFEYEEKENPGDVIRSRSRLVEHICNKKTAILETKSEFEALDSDLRKLSHRFLVDKFNEKYSSLIPEQKELLRIYVNSVDDMKSVQEHFKKIIPALRTSIQSKVKKITDDVTRIKTEGVLTILENIQNSKKIREKHIMTVLKFYELNEEMKLL